MLWSPLEKNVTQMGWLLLSFEKSLETCRHRSGIMIASAFLWDNAVQGHFSDRD